MKGVPVRTEGKVLVLGGTGFVGRKLVPALRGKNVPLRLLARTPSKAQETFPDLSRDMEIVKGDVISGEGLGEALNGVHTAYYLVHSMGGRSVLVNKEFVQTDRKAAENFVKAADEAGLKRVIYLGGLGEASEGLSEHLESRMEVGQILASGKASATLLRAAIIIGAGGASFEMLRYLVERLPVMICPRWIETRIQPIAIADVVSYLVGCFMKPETEGKTFDICGPDVLTYQEMIQQYAEARGLARRKILVVPVLTPLLSAYWVDLVTPVPSGVAHPLIEGLKTEVICKDTSIDGIIPFEKTPFKEAVKQAFSEETEGPGVTGF